MAFKIGTSGSSGTWRGVIRNEKGKVLWTCPHVHCNRDNGRSPARACAGAHLDAAENEDYGLHILNAPFSNNSQIRPEHIERVKRVREAAPDVRRALNI